MPGKTRTYLIVAGLSLALAATAHAQQKKKELVTGASAQMLAVTCAGCHGPNGASGGPATPTISGFNPEYFMEVMEGFASGEVPSTIMGRIAKGYSKDEIKKMADYYAKLPFVPAKQNFDPALAKKGAKLHQKYCEKCHSEGGKKPEEDSGILAGQWIPYLHFTMEDFIKGDREMTKKMKKKVKKLLAKEGDKGIQALMHYWASQQ